jgi:outer membrane receptor protein involved in Fe transport
VVFTPTFLPNFVATVDYWKISMEGGILYPSADEIVEQCYSAPTLDNQFCQMFTRVSQGVEGVLGVVDALEQRPVNVSQIQTSGIDFSLSYQTDLGYDAGSLSLSFAGTKLEELMTQPTVAPKLVDEVGQVSTLLGGQAPEWVFNFDAAWERGPVTIAYGAHFQSALDRYTADEVARSPDISELMGTKDLFVHDIQADYRFNEGLRAYLGVNNLSDRLPDVTYLNVPVGARGRYVYMGLSASFESLSGIGLF